MEDSDVPPGCSEEGVVDGVRVGRGEGYEVRATPVLSASGSTGALEGEKLGGVGADASPNTLLLEDQSVDEEVEVSTTSFTGESAWLSADAHAFLDSVAALETPPPIAAP